MEAVLEGDERGVELVVEVCRRGPRGARVDEVELFEEEPEGLAGFGIL